MKSTGIVRRIDDLGRVIIPKEIRRNLNVKEGDPLEIFLERDCVCFKKYKPYGAADWEYAKNILSQIIDAFIILDCDGNCVETYQFAAINKQDLEGDDITTYEISEFGDVLAYLVVRKDCDADKVDIAVNVLKKTLELNM